MLTVKRAAAIAVNAAIAVLAAIGLVVSVREIGAGAFVFYTQDSNTLAMLVSCVYLVFAVRRLLGKGAVPRWVTELRYTATCCVALTFLVVVLVFLPMFGLEYAPMLLGYGTGLYHHLLCPVLSIISLIFLESEAPLPRASMGIAFIPTIIYAVITTVLNIMRLLVGPYPFLYVYQQPVYMSVIWFIVILGGALLIAALLRLAANRASKVKLKIKITARGV